MKKHALVWLAAIAITLTACTTSQPEIPLPQSAPTSPVVTVEALNDRTAELIKAERWSDALDSARTALEAAPANPTTNLLLGQVYLGLDQPIRAAEVWVAALEGALAGNSEIAEALQELPQDKNWSLAVADIDGDGRPDLLKANGTRLTIHGGHGGLIYEGEIWEPASQDSGHFIFVHEIANSTPLIQVAIPTCPSAPQNQLFWFDPIAGEVRPVELEGPCASFAATEDGRFSYGMRDAGFYYVNIFRFEGGVLQPDEQMSYLSWAPQPEQLGHYLTTIVQWPLVEPEQLFTSLEVWEAFLERTAEGQWQFETVGEPTDGAIELQIFRDGVEFGVMTVHTQEREYLKITDIIWP